MASETGAAYTQFEDAFPLADGWLALCLVAASYCLWTARRAALFWLLAGGGAGLYLFAMDVLYDLQHGVWGKGANGVMELIINLVTLAFPCSSCAGPGSVATPCFHHERTPI